MIKDICQILYKYNIVAIYFHGPDVTNFMDVDFPALGKDFVAQMTQIVLRYIVGLFKTLHQVDFCCKQAYSGVGYLV